MILHAPDKIAAYTTNGWWGTTTIDDLFRTQVGYAPDKEALVDPVNRTAFTEGDPRRYTYAELDTAVNRVAAALGGAGLGKDSIIGIQLPNTVDLVIAYLAIARIGAIASPFPIQYREYELESLLNHVGAQAFITAARILDRAAAQSIVDIKRSIPTLRTVFSTGSTLPEGVQSWDSILATPHDINALNRQLSTLKVDANDVYTICWTSGTESKPKGVPRTANDWIAIAYATVDSVQMTASDRLLNPFPLINMAGIGGMMVPWLLTGCTLIMHQPFDLPVFLKQATLEKATYTVAPPALLTLLLLREEILAQADISSMRVIGSGSAPLSPFMVKTWQVKHGIPVTNFFGSNEGIALLGDPAVIADPEKRALFFPRFGAEGFTFDTRISKGMKTRLVNPDTEEVITAPGIPGEMRIQGPTVFSGYYNDPDLTATSFDKDGYYRTGDMFEIAGENKEYYRYVDRLKDVIIRGGQNISAAEIEGHLQGHPKLIETAVIGYPDEVMGEKICVVAVVKPGETLTLQDIHEHLNAKHVASFKLPERLKIVPALPRNPVGKILKRELRGS